MLGRVSDVDQDPDRILPAEAADLFQPSKDVLALVVVEDRLHGVQELDDGRNLEQGCQIFLGTIYQYGENILTGDTIYIMSLKYTKCP
jgi:hypothetical protein